MKRSDQADDEIVMYLRLPRDLHDAVKAAAKADDRSVASYVRMRLKCAVLRRELIEGEKP